MLWLCCALLTSATMIVWDLIPPNLKKVIRMLLQGLEPAQDATNSLNCMLPWPICQCCVRLHVASIALNTRMHCMCCQENKHCLCGSCCAYAVQVRGWAVVAWAHHLAEVYSKIPEYCHMQLSNDSVLAAYASLNGVPHSLLLEYIPS
jgi:hypothetical protein